MSASEAGRGATPEEGRVRPPYGGIERCVNSDCREPLGEEQGVYMHTNRESGKIIMFCGPCSRQAQMCDSLRFPLVAL